MSDSNCPDKLEPSIYDTILVYCQGCQERMDVPITHKEATNNQFQLMNIPSEIRHKLENYKVCCRSIRERNEFGLWWVC